MFYMFVQGFFYVILSNKWCNKNIQSSLIAYWPSVVRNSAQFNSEAHIRHKSIDLSYSPRGETD